MRIKILTLLVFPLGMWAQSRVNQPALVVYGDPPGGVGSACVAPQPFYANVATGVMASCVSSTWTAFGSGGGGGGATILGTASQITATGTACSSGSGNCILSIPSVLTLPGTVNKLTLTAPATGATLTIANGKTLTASNTLTFTGTDSSSVAFGAGGTVLYTGGAVTSLAGTANQITASASTGAVTLSLPSSVILPGTLTATGITTTGGGAAGYWQLGQGTPPSLGTTAVTLYAPTSVTSYGIALPSAAASGIPTWTASGTTVTESVTATTGSGSVVLSTSPTLTLTNATNLPISTGVSGLGSGVSTFLATPSGANFNSMIASGGIPINCSGTCSKTAAYTTVLGDGGGMIIHAVSDNNARTFTIDSNANVAYPLYTVLTFVNGINTLTIAITSDTMTLAGTASTGSRTLAANGVATAVKIGTTSWLISGPGLT